MSLRVTRLGVGEWLLWAGSVLMLVDLFGVSWFAYRSQFHSFAAMAGQPVSANGWQSFEVVGPLAAVVCAAGIAIPWLTASRRSPALPVALATLLAPVAVALALLVAVRVLILPPAVHLLQAGGADVIEVHAGAWLGLGLSVAILAGSYLTLRRDAVAPGDSAAISETLRVGG